MWSLWLKQLQRRPVLVNGAQGSVLCAAGDATAQWLESAPSLDRPRCVRAAAIGTFFAAIVYPPVYRQLDVVWPGTGVRAVVSKSLSECALLGMFGNATSIWLRGAEPREVMPGVLLNELRVWLPYNLLAFKFVPVHVRPTTTMALTFCWHTYISATAAAATRGPDR